MQKNRLEAFSDGVFAIIITIMVLELKTPHGASWQDLLPLSNTILSYILSFIYVGIYWNNHHHMVHLAHGVNGKVLWANLHLLFWLSLVPFVTGWLGETRFASAPAAAYGLVLLMAAIAYWILQNTIISHQGSEGPLGSAVGGDAKGKASIGLYVLAVVISGWSSWAAMGVYTLVAAIWFIPDRRIEKALHGSKP